MVNIAILGFGTVGSGVYEVVTKNNIMVGASSQHKELYSRVALIGWEALG